MPLIATPLTGAHDAALTTTNVDQHHLATAAEATMRRYFNAQNHRPSSQHWTALRAILDTLDTMASGDCQPALYVSAIDPGVGKSTAVQHWAQQLVSSRHHRRVGMLICVGRIAEAQAMAEALQDCREHVAVLTSDPAVNALGGAPEPDMAQVLVVTQQRVEMLTTERRFEGVSGLFYAGQPRAVRVWDESFHWGKAASLRRYDLLGLLSRLERVSRDCACAVEDFAASLPSYADGSLIAVPDFDGTYNGALTDLKEAVADTGTDHADTVAALLAMNGGAARVQSEGQLGNAVLSYRNTLPGDLTPLLVLDASARVRATYSLMERRGDVVHLPGAAKDYGPMVVGLWTKAGSKSGFERDGATLAKGVADTIATRPDERWLVVVHRKAWKRDAEGDVRRLLKGQVGADRLTFIPWGQHMARNDCADISNVILAGTLFYSEGHYRALSHLSQDQPMTVPVEADDIAAVKRGEHAHDILQAVCRGSVRKSDGDRCQPQRTFIIASKRSGVADDLQLVFPGCRVVPWEPLRPALKGNIKRAVDHVRHAFDAGAVEIAVRKVREALHIADRNFRRDVTTKPEWRDALDRLGVKQERGYRGTAVLRRAGVALGSPGKAAGVGPQGGR